MPSVLKTLSRHGRASYETPDTVFKEKRALSGIVDVLDDNQNANIRVIHSKCRFDSQMLAQDPNIELIITTTSGYDHIDLEACRVAGIRVARLPMVRRDAVVESTFAFLMSAIKRLPYFRDAAVAGQWMRSQLPQIAPGRLNGKRVGVIGCGVIGSQFLRVLEPLGCDLVAMDPRGVPGGVAQGSLSELAQCDILSLHCDLNESSRHLISADFLKGVKKGMILINTARGGLVDVDAAVKSLDMGVLHALCLDVFPEEPYDNLSVIRGRKGLYLTPHSAGFYPEIGECIAVDVVETVTAFVAGEPLPYGIV